jgi:RNA polymerase sigma-70 factor, ECF subfamily
MRFADPGRRRPVLRSPPLGLVPSVSSDDKQLIRQCLAGRTEAFGELVVRYQDRLCNSLFRVLGSADDARDAAQDAFVQAFQKLKTFRGNSAFYSWLFRIALNAAATQRRRARTKPTSIDSMRESSGRTPADPHPESAPSHSMERAERQKAVQAALAALPAEFRIPLVLKEIEGLKYQEIAEIVGCPIGTVRSRIHRARAELRQRLASQLHEEESSAPQE